MFDVELPWLFLDASSVAARVGVWQNARWLAWRESEAPALEAIFAGVRAALDESGIPLEKLGGYLYVEGPGSVLGLRLTAMAIRAWQTDEAARKGGKMHPVWAGGSLHLAAALALAGGTPPPFAVFTEARQGHWHVFDVHGSAAAPVGALSAREVGENGLPAGALFHVPARKAWHQPPPHGRPLSISLHDHPETLLHPNLFRLAETPTPFTGTAPEYKKWAGAKA
jgi:tRNA threonylcarbamoyladenosine biosynthesis protein TsaB